MSTSRLLVGLLAVVALPLLIYIFAESEGPDSTEPVAPAPVSPDIQRPEAVTAHRPVLPVADLRLALTDSCVAGAAAPEEMDWTAEGIQAWAGAFNEQMRSLSLQLSVSSSAEHLHLAALLEQDPVLRFELLDRAISSSPSDPFLVWGAVQICSGAVETTPCPLRDWEQLLIVLDGQNSESWVRVAANRYAAGDEDAALEAMRRASTAAETRAYWTETIEMTERGLAAGSDLPFTERADMAFRVAGSKLPLYRDYLKMCRERSSQSVDWAYACLAYGELVENQGKSEMGVSMARSLQKIVLENMGEVGRAAEVQQRIQASRQANLESIRDYNPMVERLIVSKPVFFSAYLAAIRLEGEQAARGRIAVEIERLLEQQPDLACE